MRDLNHADRLEGYSFDPRGPAALPKLCGRIRFRDLEIQAWLTFGDVYCFHQSSDGIFIVSVQARALPGPGPRC